MKKTMMYLPEDLHRWLARESAARGVSMAEIAREAISEYRAKGRPEPALGVAAMIGIIDDAYAPDPAATPEDAALADYFKPGGRWDQENGLAPKSGPE